MWKLLSATALVVTTAAIAQAPEDPGSSRGPDNDPNKMVCVTQNVVGSRLDRRRVCRTRSEWESHRADTRKEVEESQYFKPTFCGGAGRPC